MLPTEVTALAAMRAVLLRAVCIVAVFAHMAPAQQPAVSSGAGQTSGQVLFLQGVASLKAAKFAEAEAAFRKLTELEPEGLKGTLGVVQVYLAQKKTEDAIGFLQAEAARNPARPDIRMALGDTAMRAGLYDLAIMEFKTALSLGGSTLGGAKGAEEMAVPRGAAGATFPEGFTWDDPLAQSLNLLTGKDSTPKGAAGIHVRLAEAFRVKGDHAASAQEWQATAELLPKTGWVLMNLGMELDAAGKKQECMKVYREALTLAPSNATLLNNLAFLIAETGGDLYEALRYARNASSLAPGTPGIMDTEGWVALKLGFTDDAVATLLRVVEKQPENREFRSHLALAIAQHGVHSPATDELLKALNSPPVAGDESTIRLLLGNVASENLANRGRTSVQK